LKNTVSRVLFEQLVKSIWFNPPARKDSDSRLVAQTSP
jgi:hypothetical protein